MYQCYLYKIWSNRVLLRYLCKLSSNSLRITCFDQITESQFYHVAPSQLLFLMVLGTIPLVLVIVTAGLMTLGCTYILDNFCRKDQKDFKRKQYGIVCINEQDRLADIHEE